MNQKTQIKLLGRTSRFLCQAVPRDQHSFHTISVLHDCSCVGSSSFMSVSFAPRSAPSNFHLLVCSPSMRSFSLVCVSFPCRQQHCLVRRHQHFFFRCHQWLLGHQLSVRLCWTNILRLTLLRALLPFVHLHSCCSLFVCVCALQLARSSFVFLFVCVCTLGLLGLRRCCSLFVWVLSILVCSVFSLCVRLWLGHNNSQPHYHSPSARWARPTINCLVFCQIFDWVNLILNQFLLCNLFFIPFRSAATLYMFEYWSSNIM